MKLFISGLPLSLYSTPGREDVLPYVNKVTCFGRLESALFFFTLQLDTTDILLSTAPVIGRLDFQRRGSAWKFLQSPQYNRRGSHVVHASPNIFFDEVQDITSSADDSASGEEDLDSLLLFGVLRGSVVGLRYYTGVMIILSIVLLLVDFYKCSSTCCTRKHVYRMHCSRLGSAVFALLGVLFSGYSLIISSLGLSQGPYCKTETGWSYPFVNTAGGYLVDYSSWSQCIEPSKVVEWNIILFSILIALSALQVIICICKAIHDCMIALCGTHKILAQPDHI
ncbi:transmembrane 4 L6 family member 18 isoform X2 [Ranitomeya variabilis]|uniref:transmembrane 4 L6 family member 18 isoform X2 n=1 Tax=Ranitomeya variabilis TaxID=490064 RepID=UPI004056414A